jgi:transposase
LTARHYQSGETDIKGRVSRCGDELARTALDEAAHSLLVRAKTWSSLRAGGLKIAKHRGMARGGVARKLGGAAFTGASKRIAATASKKE